MAVAFSSRNVEERRSRSVEKDLIDFDIEFCRRDVAEVGNKRTQTSAEIVPAIRAV